MPERGQFPGYYRPPSEWGQQSSGGFDVPNLPWADRKGSDNPWSFWDSLPQGMEEYSVGNMFPRVAQSAGSYAQNIWDQWRQPRADAITQASPWGNFWR